MDRKNFAAKVKCYQEIVVSSSIFAMVVTRKFVWSILILVFTMTACGNRCKRLEGPRQEYFSPVGRATKFILSTPAEMTIVKDTLASSLLEVIAQPEVFDELNIETSETTCEVSMNACFKDQETTLLSTRMKEIRSIEFTSAGEIRSGDLIEQDTIFIENSGLGDIDLLLLSENVKANSTSSGNIILAGETTNLTTTSSGSGELSAFNLFSDTVRIGNIGSGVIEVYANKYLEVHFLKPTTVRYRGNPSKINIEGEGNLVDANL
jgi:hypothetical protein